MLCLVDAAKSLEYAGLVLKEISDLLWLDDGIILKRNSYIHWANYQLRSNVANRKPRKHELSQEIPLGKPCSFTWVTRVQELCCFCHAVVFVPGCALSCDSHHRIQPYSIPKGEALCNSLCAFCSTGSEQSHRSCPEPGSSLLPPTHTEPISFLCFMIVKPVELF